MQMMKQWFVAIFAVVMMLLGCHVIARPAHQVLDPLTVHGALHLTTPHRR